MPSEPVQQFLEEGERSGLFTAEAARDALAPLTIDGTATLDAVAARLVEKKVLTAFQADQLLAGHGAACLIAARYQLQAKLGEGGMGAVYKARDIKLDRVVAVKVLPAGRLHDADAVARFQREAKALARLSHPHITQAYDSGEDQGRHFLVMEYVEGVTLAEVLRLHGALAPTLAADVIHQAAVGLQHAHEKGLVHRDVKPGNILVAGLTRPSNAAGAGATLTYEATPGPDRLKPAAAVVKLLDLGLARFLQDQVGDSQLTREGMGMGTPDYMAPEQFRDALHADARTDIYGLGCTLYHLIAGAVPFPGSSFSEKAQAHARKEPIPLEERCPEVPAGLAFVVAKMMAKHPAERYQTAGAVAEALAPFVAGSSHSVIQMRQTGRWPPGQTTMLAPVRGKRMLIGASSTALAAICLCIAVFVRPDLFGLGPASIDVPTPPEKEPVVVIPNTKPVVEFKPKKPEVVTIANGLTVAKDGAGQFTTITAALDKAQPRQVIRVLDDAVYRESLALGDRVRHRGITLEAVRRATIEVTTAGGNAILIGGVPDVTIRGFRLRANAPKIGLIHVRGASPGLTCQDLHMDSVTGGDYDGIFIGNAQLADDEPPLVVQGCTIRQPQIGIGIMGIERDYTTPAPSARIILRDNVISDPNFYGILLRGALRQVHVVGNRISGATRMAGLQLDMFKGSADVLIANNTIFECRPAVRLWDDAVHGANIEFRNNLILGVGDEDMHFLDRRPGDWEYLAPADGSLVAKAWRFEHNWRELKKAPAARSWIPVSMADVTHERIDVLSRDRDSASFLRPAKDSPLASAGVGANLPNYVGGAPPDGAEPWEWHWTWDALVNKRITVSKKKEDGGRFRSINDALKAAGPGMTVRVVDDAVYEESFTITRATKHEGLTLESTRRATIAPQKGNVAVGIFNVPKVTVRGFRLRADSEGIFLVGVIGKSPGVRIEDLEMDKSERVSQYRGISVEHVSGAADDPPVIVQNCTIQRPISGIRISGLGADYKSAQPIARVIVHSNKIIEPNAGIVLLGTVKDTIVVGNRVSGASLAAIQFEQLFPGTENILVANNTILESTTALRLRDDFAKKDRGTNIQIRANLVLAANGPDMAFVDSGGDSALDKGLGDGKALLEQWTWSHNWREISVATAMFGKEWIPPAPKDGGVKPRIDVLARDVRSANFARPAKDSPLANSGAGGALPPYVGAVPPEGVAEWDWSKTWKAHAK